METKNAVLIKIKKLLNLSQSSNVHEAAAAMARAQELMLKHGVEQAQAEILGEAVEPEEDIKDFGAIPEGSVDVGPSLFNLPRWKSSLLIVLADQNACKGYIGRRKGMRSLELIGRPSDAETVRYMYTFLSKEIKRLCDRDGKGLGGTWRNNYCIGAVHGLYERLLAMKATTEAAMKVDAQVAGGHALILLDKALVQLEKKHKDVSVWSKKNTKLRSAGNVPAAYNSGAREVGKKASGEIQLNKAGKLTAGSKQLGD